MPIFRITDRRTGKTIRVNSQGTVPPSQAQAKDLFDQYNRSQQPETSVTPTPPASATPRYQSPYPKTDDPIANSIDTISRPVDAAAEFLVPRTKQFITQDYPKFAQEQMDKLAKGQFFNTPQEMLDVQKKSFGMAAPVFGELASYAVPAGRAFAPGQTLVERAAAASIPGIVHGISTPGNLNLAQRNEQAFKEGAISAASMLGLGYGGEKLGSFLGGTALGRGGQKLPEIIKESGSPYIHKAQGIKDTLYEATGPIRDKLNSFLTDDPGRINYSEIFGSKVPVGKTHLGEPTFYAKEGSSLLERIAGEASGVADRKAAREYIDNVEIDFNEKLRQYLVDNGIDPEIAFKRSQKAIMSGNAKLPLAFWKEFLSDIGKDTNWTKVEHGQLLPVQQEIAKQLYGKLRTMIAERSSNPELVNKLFGLEAASSDILANVTGKLAKPTTDVGALQKLLGNYGIPATAFGLLMKGQPLAAAGATGVQLAKSPLFATLYNSLGAKYGPQTAETIMKIITGQLDRTISPQTPPSEAPQ